MKKKCLFLGYNYKQTKIIKKIKSFNNKGQSWSVKQTKKIITFSQAKKYHSIISFGYKNLIDKKIIEKLNIPIINLHIGYLPYNKGAHPNFWSFMEDTPSGVTIHKLDSGIDTGKIIFQKKVNFKPQKYKKRLTFSKTYAILINEIEKLFIKKIKILLNQDFKSYKQKGAGTFHKYKDLPKFLKNWNQNIYKTKKKFEEIYKI